MSKTEGYRQAAIEHGFKPKTIYRRITRGGKTLAQAISYPVRTLSITARAKEVGLERTTIYKRRSRYGLSLDEAFSSTGKCECCDDPAKLHADHDHATGKFRGWLCPRCNHGLGHFKDDPARLRRAIEYLSRTTLADSVSGRGLRDLLRATDI